MRNPVLFVTIFTTLILIIDFYSYRGVKKLTSHFFTAHKRLVFILFWAVPALLIMALLFFAVFNNQIEPSNYLAYFHVISGTFILFYLPKLVFILFNLTDDIVLLTQAIYRKLTPRPETQTPGEPITRTQFLNKIGVFVAAIPFISAFYGIAWGRFNFVMREHTLTSAKIPPSFSGLRIVQISDFHIGSFAHHPDKVEKAVEFINAQDADLLLFTGDFVNNVASEMEMFMPTLQKLTARLGKFSVLGNHDYGEYVPWKSAAEKKKNLLRLMQMQREVGFNLLMNEAHTLTKDNQSIELIGVENWGLPPFPQYGDLNKALAAVKQDSFKILLSHDPTHFDEQVKFTDIDLTLSGHTHGAQFGIEIPGWRWSPVSMRYTYWGGLYQEGNKYINVNTGLGFIGFPGRVGMPPEVTVFKLKSV